MRINDTYEITLDGQVRNSKTGRILKTSLTMGYKTLRLGTGKHHYIHHLVAHAYLPFPTEELCVIDHIDRNKQNNHAYNLRWVSRTVNCENRTIETKPRASNKQGHHHIKKVLTKRQVVPSYAVVYNNKVFKHYSLHKTLDEAIAKRNSLWE